MSTHKTLIQNLLGSFDSSDSVRSRMLQLYSNIFDNHQEMVYILNEKGQVTYFNYNFNLFLGYKHKSKEKHWKHMRKDGYNIFHRHVQKALTGKVCKKVIKVPNHKDTMLQIEFYFTPIVAENEVIGVYITIRDVSDHLESKDLVEKKRTYLHQVSQLADIVYFECDYSTGVITFSEGLHQLFSLPAIYSTKMNLKQLLKVIHEMDYDQFIQAFYESISKNETTVVNFRIHLPNQPVQMVRGIWQSNVSESGAIKLIGVAQNITFEKDLENKLAFEEKQLQYMYDHLDGVIWNIDYQTGKVLFISEGTEEMYGHAPKAFMDNPELWFNMVHPDDRAHVFQAQKKLESGEPVQYEYRIIHKDGLTKWLEAQAIPHFDLNQNVSQLFGIARDITATKSMEALKEYEANHDPITGLYNRTHFYKTIKEWCEDSLAFALIYLDLKRFSSINQSLGFKVADEILRQTTDRLLLNLDEDLYVARVSGSIFGIILRNYHGEKEAYHLTQKLLDGIASQFQVNNFELTIEVSGGICFYPKDTQSPDQLIQLTSLALQRAKEIDGSNYQVYYKSDNLISHKRYELEKDLIKAIELKELELYYQPRIRPSDHVIVGVEALIRWNHPTWGIVTPREFIPLAEESHLITDISMFVVEEACRQLSVWHKEGLSYRMVSVNISPQCFLTRGFIDHITYCLQKFNINGKWLEIEITETMLIKNEEMMRTVLKELKSLDIRIALDDFGTGFSSLKYVNRFPIDTIKIDKSFIEHVGNEGSSENLEINKEEHLISTIIFLAHGLKMNVVAEGVENDQQLKFLIQKEIDEVQGYIYSKPKPAFKLSGHLKSGKIIPERMKKKPKMERRKYYRIPFEMPLKANMMIKEVKGKKVGAGYTDILIKDISIGGLKFVSSLNIPVRPDVKMLFEIKILGEKLTLEGRILWKNEMKYNTYDYGVKFQTDQALEDHLAEIVNKLTVLKRNNLELPDTPIIYENPHSYIHKVNSSS